MERRAGRLASLWGKTLPRKGGPHPAKEWGRVSTINYCIRSWCPTAPRADRSTPPVRHTYSTRHMCRMNRSRSVLAASTCPKPVQNLSKPLHRLRRCRVLQTGNASIHLDQPVTQMPYRRAQHSDGCPASPHDTTARHHDPKLPGHTGRLSSAIAFINSYELTPFCMLDSPRPRNVVIVCRSERRISANPKSEAFTP